MSENGDNHEWLDKGPDGDGSEFIKPVERIDTDAYEVIELPDTEELPKVVEPAPSSTAPKQPCTLSLAAKKRLAPLVTIAMSLKNKY